MESGDVVVSADCEHVDWTASAEVIRHTDTEDGPIVGWTVELRMRCLACTAPMLWLVTDHARLDVLTAPCRPCPPGIVP